MRPLNSSAIPALAFIASELLQHTAYVFKAISRYIAISTVESIPFDDLSDRRHTAQSSTAHVPCMASADAPFGVISTP